MFIEEQFNSILHTFYINIYFTFVEILFYR